MAVYIKRDGDGSMAGAFACNFWIHPGRQKVAQVRVSQIMEPDASNANSSNHARKFVGEGARLERLAIEAADDEGLRVFAQSQRQPKLGLLFPMFA